MSSYARTERAQLADLLDELGPDQPTLCTGWTTKDLAVHLVVRERRPLGAPGIVVAALAGLTERESATVGAQPYAQLVDLVRTGPPRWSLLSVVPALDEVVNTTEFFVHHEDVRRARDGWQPRVLDLGLERALWSSLRRTGRLMLRRSPCRMLLREPDGGTVRGGTDGPVVTVAGPASELLLFCFGRQTRACVQLDGDPSAVSAVRAAPLGL